MRAGKADVAVIGGGPAGCSAAIHLAKAGARVVLFESQTYPHDKVCGEFLSPECWALLENLDLLPAIRALRPAEVRSIRFVAPDGAFWEGDLPGRAIGLSRRWLDAALAGRAAELGVEVRQDTHVTGIQGGLRAGFRVRTREARRCVQARAVIAAHGKRSPLDRALGRPFIKREHPFLALKAHFDALPVPARTELYGFPGGYCGLSEIEGGASVVSLLAYEPVFKSAGESSPARDGAETFFRWIQKQNPVLGERLAGAEQIQENWLAIAQIAFDRKGATSGDVLMAGDAAGLVAPLVGDGIAMALRSGELAAGHAIRFLGGQLSPGQLLRDYSLAWRREFQPRLRLARLLQAFALRPRLLSPGLRLLSLVPSLGQKIIRSTREPAHPGRNGFDRLPEGVKE